MFFIFEFLDEVFIYGRPAYIHISFLFFLEIKGVLLEFGVQFKSLPEQVNEYAKLRTCISILYCMNSMLVTFAQFS